MKYIKLLRVKHYLKNSLVFLPLIFSGRIMVIEDLLSTTYAFIAFCAASSVIYIINDIQDIEKDKKHPVKCKRAIASGVVTIKKAKQIAVLLFIICVLMQMINSTANFNAWIVLILYISFNLLYSVGGWKNYPLLDVIIVVSGFVLRIIYGSVNADISISAWLYLVVFSGAFYLGFGKRRNELERSGPETRKVLKYYSKGFLDKNMYSCMTLSIVFYSLWCLEKDTLLAGQKYLFTVPLLMVIFFRYSMNIEGDSEGDPVNVICSDKILILIVLIFVILIFMFLYF